MIIKAISDLFVVIKEQMYSLWGAAVMIGIDSSGDPQPVRVNSSGAASAILGAGELHLGEVSTPADLIDVTPTVETTALDAGDVVCNSTTITNAVRVATGQAILQSLMVIDKSDQGAALDIFIMDTTGLTFGTLDSAPSVSDSDAAKILGIVSIASDDWFDVGGAKVANVKGIGLLCEAASGRNLAFAATTSGTPTYTSASALVFRFGFLW